jgi:hypothetical protein
MIPTLHLVVNRSIALAHAKMKVAWYRYLEVRCKAKIIKWSTIEKRLKH